jgi:predicted RNase H-like nuclease (RuvC/YqgF family)
MTVNAGGSLGSSTSFSVVPSLGRSLNGSSTTLSLTDRVDLAVRRLGELRSWSREEAKGRRNLEERSESQEQELLSAQNTLEDTQKALRKASIQSSEKETEMREKQREITGLQMEINTKQEEIERLRRDDSSLGKCFELLCSLPMPFGWVYVFYVGHIEKIMKPFSTL